MTFADCVGPGRQSLRVLGWLARVGASPPEPLALVLGCGERVARDHVRRLQAAGLVRRVAMRRGDGSLVVLTRSGAIQAGESGSRALRSVAPTTWAHTSACAWVSAWLELRGRSWWSEREIAEDAFWRGEVRYRDRRGSVRVGHRPDLGADSGRGPVAIEVELQPKSRARLRGILGMYHALCDGPLGGGVLYVTATAELGERVRDVAGEVGLGLPPLSLRSLELVIAQTRAAALQRATHPTVEGAV